jgi:predicted RNase H-like HicB family nuclease
MKFVVRITREGQSWLADVPTVPGAATFAGNLIALELAVREVLSLLLDIEDESVFEFEFEFSNVGEEMLAAVELGKRREELEREQKEIMTASARFIQELSKEGYSVRDLSGILHMSPGRVSQIAKETERQRA